MPVRPRRSGSRSIKYGWWSPAKGSSILLHFLHFSRVLSSFLQFLSWLIKLSL